jgi:hypothetical protein
MRSYLDIAGISRRQSRNYGRAPGALHGARLHPHCFLTGTSNKARSYMTKIQRDLLAAFAVFLILTVTTIIISIYVYSTRDFEPGAVFLIILFSVLSILCVLLVISFTPIKPPQYELQCQDGSRAVSYPGRQAMSSRSPFIEQLDRALTVIDHHTPGLIEIWFHSPNIGNWPYRTNPDLLRRQQQLRDTYHKQHRNFFARDWTVEEIHHELRGLARDMSLVRTLVATPKNDRLPELEWLKPISATSEQQRQRQRDYAELTRLQLIDSPEDLRHKTTHLFHILLRLDHIEFINAVAFDGISFLVQKFELIAMLEDHFRQLELQRARLTNDVSYEAVRTIRLSNEYDAERRASEADSPARLNDLLQRLQITRQINEEAKKLGNAGIADTAQELHDLHTQYKDLTKTHKEIADDIKDIYKRKKREITEKQ